MVGGRCGEAEESTDINTAVVCTSWRPYSYDRRITGDGTVVPVCFYQVGNSIQKLGLCYLRLLKDIELSGGVCDATGVGEPLAHYLKEQIDRNNVGLVEAYKFKASGDESKSKLGIWFMITYLTTFKDTLPHRPDQRELWQARWQLEHLTREAKKHQSINSLCTSERRTT